MRVVKIDKIYLNAPILDRLKGCGYNSRATFIGAGTVSSHVFKGCRILNPDCIKLGRFMAAHLPAKSSRQPQLSLENNKKSARFSPAGTDFYECGHCGQVSLMD